MIIRSQNKKNTTTDMDLSIITNEVVKCAVSFEELLENFGKEPKEKIYESKIYNSSSVLLGTYSSEEKAIKVMDALLAEYEKGTLIFDMPGDNYI